MLRQVRYSRTRKFRCGRSEQKPSRRQESETCARSKRKDKTPVFGMVERGGRVVANVVSSTSEKDLLPHITRTVEVFSEVLTDERVAYKN